MLFTESERVGGLPGTENAVECIASLKSANSLSSLLENRLSKDVPQAARIFHIIMNFKPDQPHVHDANSRKKKGLKDGWQVVRPSLLIATPGVGGLSCAEEEFR